jgi:hypothetical protein
MPKYDPDLNDDWVTRDTRLAKHGSKRWRERTPDDSCIDVDEAFRNGDEIKHPQVARQYSELDDPDRAVVYKEQDWGVVFILERDNHVGVSDNYIIVTVVSLDMISHGPTRCYLYSYGPHSGSQL